jgi:hypothetical protein
MSARKRKAAVRDGWPHAYANIEFEPLILPVSGAASAIANGPRRRRAFVKLLIACSVCKMDCATLRGQTAKLVAADGDSADGAFIAMLELLSDSIERVKALQALLKGAECGSFAAYAAVEAGLVEEVPT